MITSSPAMDDEFRDGIFVLTGRVMRRDTGRLG